MGTERMNLVGWVIAVGMSLLLWGSIIVLAVEAMPPTIWELVNSIR